MSARPKQGIIPPGGWHVMEGEVKVEAVTLPELYKALSDFRLENGRPVGNVEEDVNNFICGRFPRHCNPGRGQINSVSVQVGQVSNTEQSPTNILIDDVTAWATRLLRQRERYDLVTDKLADDRAKICKACPLNVSYQSGCQTCVDTAEKVCAQVRQGKDTRTTSKLGACRALRQDNRTACFLDLSALQRRKELPGPCWLKLP